MPVPGLYAGLHHSGMSALEQLQWLRSVVNKGFRLTNLFLHPLVSHVQAVKSKLLLLLCPGIPYPAVMMNMRINQTDVQLSVP